MPRMPVPSAFDVASLAANRFARSVASAMNAEAQRMADARRLYEKKGFEKLDRPLGATGHFGCDAWYAREL